MRGLSTARDRFAILPAICSALRVRLVSAPPPRQAEARRRSLRCRSEPDFQPPLERSALFESDIVQREVDNIFDDMRQLASMLGKWPYFDTAGKAIYLQNFEAFEDRMRTLMARFKLAKDPAGDYLLSQLNRQYLEMSTNMDLVQEELRRMLANMRDIVAQEERIQDAAQLRAFREGVAAQLLPQCAPLYLMATLSKEELGDPAFAAGMMDPQMMVAVTDCMEDPRRAAKYAGKPALHRVLLRVFPQ